MWANDFVIQSLSFLVWKMGSEEKSGECGLWDPNGRRTLFVPVTKELQLLYQRSAERSPQEEAELLERMHGAQVWVFALLVLLSCHLERPSIGPFLFLFRFRARRKVFCTHKTWQAPMGMCAAGGWVPGMPSSASSIPPASSLYSLLQVDTPWPWLAHC